MSGRPRRADPGGCAAVTASGRPSNAHSGGVPVVESRGQASTRTPGSDDYASPAPGAASPDGSPENPLARGGYMDSGIGAGRVVPRADVLEHRASTSPAAQAGAGSFQGSIPQYQRNGSGLFDNHPQRSHPRHVEHRAAGGTVRGVASPTVAFRTSRSDSTPGDWDGNLRCGFGPWPCPKLSPRRESLTRFASKLAGAVLWLRQAVSVNCSATDSY